MSNRLNIKKEIITLSVTNTSFFPDSRLLTSSSTSLLLQPVYLGIWTFQNPACPIPFVPCQQSHISESDSFIRRWPVTHHVFLNLQQRVDRDRIGFAWGIFRGLWPGHGRTLSPLLISSRMTTETDDEVQVRSLGFRVSNPGLLLSFSAVFNIRGYVGKKFKEWGNSSSFNYIALPHMYKLPLRDPAKGARPLVPLHRYWSFILSDWWCNKQVVVPDLTYVWPTPRKTVLWQCLQ